MSTYLVKVQNEVTTWNYVAIGKTVDEAIEHFRNNYGSGDQGPGQVLAVNYVTESEDYEQVLKHAKRQMEDICLEVKNLMCVVEKLAVKMDDRKCSKHLSFATCTGYEIRQVLDAARDKVNAIDEYIHLVHGYTEE